MMIGNKLYWPEPDVEVTVDSEPVMCVRVLLNMEQDAIPGFMERRWVPVEALNSIQPTYDFWELVVPGAIIEHPDEGVCCVMDWDVIVNSSGVVCNRVDFVDTPTGWRFHEDSPVKDRRR